MIKGIVASALLLFPAAIAAQAVTTAGIRGRVSGGGRENIDARVRVSDDATGFAVEARTNLAGQFLIQGLEPGGSYTVVARSLGYVLQGREKILLTLGETREINFVLQPVAARMDTVGDSPQTSRPIFRFTGTNVGWTTNPDDSAFQLQLAVRYRF